VADSSVVGFNHRALDVDDFPWGEISESEGSVTTSRRGADLKEAIGVYSGLRSRWNGREWCEEANKIDGSIPEWGTEQ
jgi:hypothetical protein